jgi:hypothetical protein
MAPFLSAGRAGEGGKLAGILAGNRKKEITPWIQERDFRARCAVA